MMPTTDNPDDGTMQTEMTEMGDVPAQSPDAGASLPNPEEVRAANPSRQQKNGKFCLIVFVFATLILTGVAIALGVTLGDTDSGEGFARKSTPESIQDYIVDQDISSGDVFLLTEGAQTKAVEWMAFEDRLNLPTPSSSASPSENRAAYDFVLRYVMAVLYFSMNGPEWTYQFSFLSEKDTCNWNGLLQNSQGGFISYGLICNREDRRAFAIYLDNLELEGELPNELKFLTTIRQLDFNFNGGLSGEFPLSVCEMEDLDTLSIGYTALSGSLPSCVAGLSELRLLFLPDNKLSGNLPSLRGMDSLERIFLDDNDLSGDISTAFDTLTELRFVFLEDNNFGGTLDEFFMADCEKLIQIDISDNSLEGDIPIHMLEFPDIQVIDIHGNFIDGALPSTYPPSNLLFFALHDNDVTGQIDGSISNLFNLFHLDLSNNDLSGEIASEIGEMTNLTYLFLGQNGYDESFFPDSFANLTNMEEFSVKSSNFIGELPEFISTWTSLKLLDMDGNQFQQQIPLSWGDLVNLEFLLLNDNLLTGPFPPSFKNLVNLRAGFFENTGISGNMTIMCELPNFQELDNDLDGNELLVADCVPSDTITVECGCCICCDKDSDNEDRKCNDHELIANLDPTWEFIYNRVSYDFGNETRFVSRDFLS